MSSGSAPPPGGAAPPGSPPLDAHFPDLAAYVLGAMAGEEEAAFERHLRECLACRHELPGLRESLTTLDGVPPELLIDGPPENAELLVRRTVRRIRAQEPATPLTAPSHPTLTHARGLMLVAAAAVGVAFAVGGVIGRETAPAPVAEGPSTPGVTATATGPRGASTDARTGVSLAVEVTSLKGWVRLKATTAHNRPGERCHLFVVARDGSRMEVGSWLNAGAEKETTLDASALVDAADLSAVQVRTGDGDLLVSTKVV